MARYFTPRSANGIIATIIRALKITADNIADPGVLRCMMLSALSTGKVPANIAGMMAKYLATSLAMEKVIHSGLSGYGGGGERVVSRDHDRANAHGPQLAEAFLDAAFHDVLEIDHA